MEDNPLIEFVFSKALTYLFPGAGWSTPLTR